MLVKNEEFTTYITSPILSFPFNKETFTCTVR